jgi:hypothetical protein
MLWNLVSDGFINTFPPGRGNKHAGMRALLLPSLRTECSVLGVHESQERNLISQEVQARGGEVWGSYCSCGVRGK